MNCSGRLKRMEKQAAILSPTDWIEPFKRVFRLVYDREATEADVEVERERRKSWRPSSSPQAVKENAERIQRIIDELETIVPYSDYVNQNERKY